MSVQTSAEPGKVYLVGTGPGHPELITVRGLHLLRQADVVVWDRLIPEALLQEVPAHAELIYAGKAPGHHHMEQAQINALLIAHARAGKRVVRLKGGDPCVFGRGGEEALALAEAGIPFEIVPGVTSAVAVPAFAGIPVTHRGLATGFAVVTGHVARGSHHGVEWSHYAHVPTLVVLMGMGQVDHICRALVAAGRRPDTPAAAITWGTTSAQRTLVTTLAALPEAIHRAGLTPPGVLVIGHVVTLARQLAWFFPHDVAPREPLPAICSLAQSEIR
ncbi:MAG: uroporphyrinogen-III C-methyltransferase [Ardenticatenia bacterium]|nr:uroporphyrinogen-III C-methyltransferase [Ardenticatenia bacterium]